MTDNTTTRQPIGILPKSTLDADFDLITANQHTFINTLHSKSTVIDLGGNRGGFSKIILSLFDCEKVIILEGNPHLIPIINKNLINYNDQTEIIHALIGSTPSSKVDFHITEDPEASLVNKSLNSKQKFIETIGVKMITLDTVLDFVGDTKIDLLKVDIEGMEWEVLLGLTQKEYDQIDQITVEFHDFLDSKLVHKTEQVIEHLTHLGYQFIKGKYESGVAYYDTLFCKPELYKKYVEQQIITSEEEKNNRVKHILIERVEDLVKQQGHHQKEIEEIYSSLSWKITSPLRKLAAIFGFKK